VLGTCRKAGVRWPPDVLQLPQQACSRAGRTRDALLRAGTLRRDDARTVLVAMVAELGREYLPFAITVLRAALPAKGYMGHVLGFTLHAVLAAVVQARPRGCSAAAVCWQGCQYVRGGFRPPGALRRLIVSCVVWMRAMLASPPSRENRRKGSSHSCRRLSSASTLAWGKSPVITAVDTSAFGRAAAGCRSHAAVSWTALPRRAALACRPGLDALGACARQGAEPGTLDDVMEDVLPVVEAEVRPRARASGRASELGPRTGMGQCRECAACALARACAQVRLAQELGPMVQACSRQLGRARACGP